MEKEEKKGRAFVVSISDLQNNKHVSVNNFYQ